MTRWRARWRGGIVDVRTAVHFRSFLSACVLAGSAWAGADPARAQTPDTPPPASGATGLSSAGIGLREAVDAAWQRAVQAREVAAQALLARAEQTRAAAWSPLPPAVEAGRFDDRSGGARSSRETDVALALPLWLPGQRQARGAAADAEAALAQAGAEAGRLRIAGQVRELAWRLATLEAEAAVALRRQDYLGRLADDVDRRVRAGDLARTDALAARAEWQEARGALSEVEQRRAAGRSQWRTLTGIERLPLLPLADAAAPRPVPAAAHPELRAAEQALERAQRRIEVVALSRRDPPELRVRYRDESSAVTGASRAGVGVAIRIPFGTAGRNAPLEAAALGELDIAETQLLRLRERLDAEVQLARAGLDRALQQLDGARERARLQQERRGLVDASFRAGETALPELLRVVDAATQAEAALARQQAAAGLAGAQLEQALGSLP